MSTVIVGGGLGGLAAARALQSRKKEFVLLEATDRIGGRVRSFRTADGFILDRGFQVILDSYPTLRRLVDVSSLEPAYFPSGALIYNENSVPQRVMHPLRHPSEAWQTLCTSLFSPAEKIGIAALGLQALLQPASEIFGKHPQGGEPSVASLLAARGIKANALKSFFRPFFGGVLLDENLETSSRIFLYYLKMFILGRAFVPARGMEQLPMQIAAGIPPDKFRLRAEVLRIRINADRAVAVQLTDGSEIPCEQLILATEEPATAKLLSRRPPTRPGRSVWTFYFSHTETVPPAPLLVLNADDGPLLHCVDLTAVSSHLAPPGNHLISATVLNPGELDEPELESAVATKIAEVFSLPSGALRSVGHVKIPYGVPSQPPGFLRDLPRESGFTNVSLAGDQITGACIEGALRSGWEAGMSAAAAD